jgi:hypothetical protein
MTRWSESCTTWQRRWSFALLIYVLALAVRGTVYYEARDWPLFTHPQIDEFTAHQIGLAFLDGDLPPEVYLKGPLYMYFVGGVAWLLGRDPMTVRLVQVFLSSLSPMLIYLIGERLFGWRIGLIAGATGALFWTIVYYSLVLVDAALSTLLYLLLLCLLVCLDDERWWKWPLCGAVLALGALSRPSILAFAPVLAVIVFIVTSRRRAGGVRGTGQVSSTRYLPETQHGSYVGTVSEGASPKGPVPFGDPDGYRVSGFGSGVSGSLVRPRVSDSAPSSSGSETPPTPETRSNARRRALINVIALTVGCGAVIAPVTLRNRLVGGEWVLIGAYRGMNLWIANSPQSDGKNVPILMGDGVPKVAPVEPNDVWTRISLGNRIARYYAEAAAGRRLKYGEIDGYFDRIGREWILNHPKEFLKKTFKRFCFFLNGYEYPNEADIYWFRETSRLIGVLSYVHFGIICPLAVFGLALAVARRQWTAPLAFTTGMLASLWLPGLFFVINARFRIVIVPLLLLFAAYGLVRAAGFCRRGVPWSHRVLAAAVLAALAVFSNINWFGYAEKYYTDHRMGFMVACEVADRKDLLPRAVERVEEALNEDLKKGGFTQTAVMEHAHPLGWLFYHHFRTGNKEKAFRYGSLMMKQDAAPLFPLMIAYCHAAMDTEHEKEAREVLRTLFKVSSGNDPALILIVTMRFGEKYRDREALLQAKRLLQELCQSNPNNLDYHGALKRVRSLLDELEVPSASTRSTEPAAPRAAPAASTAPVTSEPGGA